jgi:hypothetical protein
VKAWVIRTRDNVFLRDRGAEALSPGEAEVLLEEPPDITRERYDPLSPTRTRPVTSEELEAHVDDALTLQAQLALANPILAASFETTFFVVHRRAPTDAERAEWRARFIDEFKARYAAPRVR